MINRARPLVDNHLSKDVKDALKIIKNKTPAFVPSFMDTKKRLQENAMHNRLVSTAQTHISNQVSHGAQRLRDLRKEKPTWGISDIERQRQKTNTRAHNKFVNAAGACVDDRYPTRAMQLMETRHMTPNLGDGSWVHKQSVLENRNFHDRMLQNTRHHVNTEPPKALGAIPLAPLTRGGVMRPRLPGKKGFSNTMPNLQARKPSVKSRPQIQAEELKASLERQGLVLDELEWAELAHGLGFDPYGSLQQKDISVLFAEPAAPKKELHQPWDPAFVGTAGSVGSFDPRVVEGQLGPSFVPNAARYPLFESHPGGVHGATMPLPQVR